MAYGKYTANDVANWFLCNIDRDAGDSITHLKLQKLVYYAQAWALALLDRPLFDEDMQAWAHGPVAPSVFHRFKGNGWDALPLPGEGPVLGSDSEELLQEVMGIYGDLSGKHLEQLTHKEDPWHDARGDLPPEAYSQAVIPKEAMSAFYQELHSRLTEDG